MTRTTARLDMDGECNLPAAGFGALETERGCLPLIALDVKSHISGVTAQTTVRQTFCNTLNETLEATYIFPLPDRAAVTNFEMHVAGRTIVGDLRERGEAREDYDRAIEQGHQAAIAEEERSGVFTLRVGNLPPHEEARIELKLVGPLPVTDGEATFRFPLVVAPRYTSGLPLDGPSVGQGVVADTDEVPDASRVTPPVLLPGFANPVRLSLEVILEAPQNSVNHSNWASLVSSSLHSTLSDGETPYVVRLQPGERLDRDFILRFPVGGKSISTSLATTQPVSGNAGVFALTLLPPATCAATRPKPREVVFVLDRSGSMNGWKMPAARRTLGRMIDTLLDHDRFTVLAFDTSIEFPDHANGGALVAGTNTERWRVVEWLANIESRGGTEMEAALTRAMKCFSDGAEHDSERILVVVTDGQISGEDAVLRELARGEPSTLPRIFTVGIDRAVNAGFLRRLADFGAGACELVESEQRLDDAMDRIHRLLGASVLTNVRLEPVNFDWVSESLTPQRIGDLFADCPRTIFGRHLGDDKNLQIRIHATDASGTPWSETVTAQPTNNEMLLSMWGRAKVRDLEDRFVADTWCEQEKLAQQIVDVSLETHVLSRFTAYVAVDESRVIDQRGLQTHVIQPVEAPEDMLFCAAFPLLDIAADIESVSERRCLSVDFKRSSVQGDTSMRQDSYASDLEALNSRDEIEMLLRRASAGEGLGDDFGSKALDELLSERNPKNALVDSLIASAIKDKAGEIRLVRTEDEIQITLFIDGKPVEWPPAPWHLWDEIVDYLASIAEPDVDVTVAQVGETTVSLNYITQEANHRATILLTLSGHISPPQKEPHFLRRLFWKQRTGSPNNSEG